MLTLNLFQAKITATIFSELELWDLNHIIIYTLEWNQKSFIMTVIPLLLLLVSTFIECLPLPVTEINPLDAFTCLTPNKQL